jgi:Ger(x)C family germination protein
MVDDENKESSVMEKGRLGLALVVFIMIFAGCSNMKQINRITFITALGVDKSEVGVKVYALAAVPGNFTSLAPGAGGGLSKSPNYILSAEGQDVAAALYIMKRKSAHDIQFGHTKIVLFSDEMAKQGLNPSLDLFMRRIEFQPVAWIGITQGSVKSILQVNPESPESVSDALMDIFSRSGTDTSEILPLYVYEFFSLSVEPGQSPYVMIVKNIQKNNKIEVSDLAIFKKDRMVGILSSAETKILQILQKNKMASTSFTVQDGTFNLLKYSNKTKVKLNQISIQLQLELELDQNHGPPVASSEQLHNLEKQVNVSVQRQIEHLIEKLQGLKTDPAGFGNHYRTAVSGGFMKIDEWENEIFPKMKVDVKVNTKIQRRGSIK